MSPYKWGQLSDEESHSIGLCLNFSPVGGAATSEGKLTGIQV